MKRFTTFLVSLLFTFAAFAQTDVVVEESWNHSLRSTGSLNDITGEWQDGTYPDWMGDAWGGTERGMAHVDGKLYIPSRADGAQKITIIDTYDGSLLGAIDLPADPVSGGLYTLNNISVTASGDLILGNLAETKNTDETTGEPSSPFKAYHIVLDATGLAAESITNVIDWNNVDAGEEAPNYRVGDGIAFYGDIAGGANGYLICPVASSDVVLRWDVTDGVFAADPVMFQIQSTNPAPTDGIVNLGTAPQAYAVGPNLVIIDGGNLFPAAYDMNGQMITTFGDVGLTQPNGNGVFHFMLEGRSFIVANSTVWTGHGEDPENAWELFELVNDDFAQAVSHGFLPAEGLSTSDASNANFNYPIAVDVVNDVAHVYVMAAKVGIAGFMVTIDETTAINENPADAITTYPNPATDVVNFSERMASVKVYEMSGKFVREVTNTSQVNVSDLRGLYLINAVDTKGNTLRKTVVVK